MQEILSWSGDLANIFIGIVIPLATAVGALGIFWVYRTQNIERTRNAANIILAEMVMAEEVATGLRTELVERGVDSWLERPPYRQLMPKGSWAEYKHLFIRSLSPEEWKTVNEFYTQCALYDEKMNWNLEVDRLNTSYRVSALQEAIFDCVSDYVKRLVAGDDGSGGEEKFLADLKVEFDRSRQELNGSVSGQGHFSGLASYNPQKSVNDMKLHLDLLPEGIGRSTVAAKLRNIAKSDL